MNLVRYILLTFLVTMASSHVILAQINDARLWLTMGAEKKITRKLYTEGKVSLRINENYSEVGAYYGDLGIGYKLLKGLKVEGHYRYSGKSKLDGSFHKRHRYYVDVIYKLKTKTPLFSTFRIRYQKQYTDVNRSESGMNPANTLRGEVILGYRIKKYEPFVCTELYYLMDNSGKYFNRIRFKIGTDYEINKRNSFTIFCMIQQELNASNPVRAYIVGLGYKYIL